MSKNILDKMMRFNVVRKIFVSIIMIQVVFIASAQKELTNISDVKPVSSEFNINGSQLFYALPKNVVRVAICIEKTTQVKGPYAFYAKKYLNISEGLIGEDDLYYTIKDVGFERLSTVDSARYFVVNNINGFNIPEIKLNADGVILSYNALNSIEGYSADFSSVKSLDFTTSDFAFSDLGVHPFFTKNKETVYKTTKKDTVEIKVPVSQTKLVATTEEMNAENAADFIRKIRKRRTKLIMGIDGEVIAVDGAAMQLMIQELNRLEKEYLELFMGKEIKECQTFYVDYEPAEAITFEQSIMCWFSTSYGLTKNKPDSKRSEAKAIIMKSELLGVIPNVNMSSESKGSKSNSPIKYGLYYCMPGNVQITLQLKDDVLLKQYMQIAQKGQVLALPSEYLTDRGFAIQFYPETGAIKSISANKPE